MTIKSILRIRDYEIDNVPRDFDLAKAADYIYELADAYTVCLEFFDGPVQPGGTLLPLPYLDREAEQLISCYAFNLGGVIAETTARQSG